ncbi:MAG: hypothetical protein CSA62_05235 [Planctomycetota bacterium]|nr:MAG: hypothetical protein CSA62_05235 [Planctomycetota bacterium]
MTSKYPKSAVSKPGSNVLHCFVSCAPGLESMLEAELQRIGIKGAKQVPGGAEFTGGREPWYRALLHSGLASHVLLRVGSFRARRFEELVHRCEELPWEEYLQPGAVFDVRATCKQSKLYHNVAVEDRIAAVICDRVRPGEPEEDRDCPVFKVRFHQDHCTISLTPSRWPLHRRGYRVASGDAPLREDLAHALVLASDWQPGMALLDPFAGTGTIAIEAARMALGHAPGRLHSFAWQHLALDDESIRTRVWEEARAAEKTQLDAPIRACDRDPRAIQAMQRNFAAAGIGQVIELAEEPLSANTWLSGAEELPPQGALVTNPPFGRRLSKNDKLRALWQSFGQLGLRLPEDWKLAFLVEGRELAYASGLALESAFLTEHGGRKVNAFRRVLGDA